MTKRMLAALTALAVLSGCGSLAEQDDSPARIEAALQAYAASALAMDVDRLAASFTEDGQLQDRDGEPVRGREAIRTHLRSLAGVKVLENEIRGSWLQLVGPSALQTGTFRQKSRLADGKVVESTGTFEAEWERQPDRSWLIVRMTTNPPPFEPTTAGEVP